jgi:hypothetical protein
MGLARFMASAAGRLLRIVAGVVLIVVGLTVVKGTGGWVLAVIGLLPIAAGGMNFCLLGPLMNAPFWGSKLNKGA